MACRWSHHIFCREGIEWLGSVPLVLVPVHRIVVVLTSVRRLPRGFLLLLFIAIQRCSALYTWGMSRVYTLVQLRQNGHGINTTYGGNLRSHC